MTTQEHAEYLVSLTLGICALDDCFVSEGFRQRMIEDTIKDLEQRNLEESE